MTFPEVEGHKWTLRHGPLSPMRLYLAGPYSSGGGPRDPLLMHHRANWHSRCAGNLMLKGHRVLSPVAMHNAIKSVCELPTDWETFWRDRDFDFIHVYADALAIFALPGWDTSEGTMSELCFAVSIGKPVFLVNYGGDVTHELEKVD